MYQHPCCTAFAIGSGDGDSEEAFADLRYHFVIGEADVEMFFAGCLLIEARLCDLWSGDDAWYIRINHKIISLDLIETMSDNEF